MRRLVALSLALIGAARGDALTPPEPAASRLVHGSYTLVPVDSPGMSQAAPGSTIPLGVLTDSNEVVGFMTGQGFTGRFRWKNGVFKLDPAPSWRHQAGNRRGDLIGDLGPNRPAVWYLADAAPTRLFPFDTAVVAIDINNRGEVLLQPISEYSPGASVWFDGIAKPVNAGRPVTPRFITDTGLVWVTTRGTLVDSSWFAPSPFRAGASFRAACPYTPARAGIGVDRRGLRVLSRVDYTSGPLNYLDDGTTCLNLSFAMPQFEPISLIGEGFFFGAVADPSLGRFPFPAVSDGTTALGLPYLIENFFSADWNVSGVSAVNASGLMLAGGQKRSGYQQAKGSLILLVPKP